MVAEVQFADGVYSFQVEPSFIIAEDVIVYISHLQQVLHNHVQVSFPDILFQAMHNMTLVMVEKVEGMVPGEEFSFPSLPLELGPTTRSFLNQLMHKRDHVPIAVVFLSLSVQDVGLTLLTVLFYV